MKGSNKQLTRLFDNKKKSHEKKDFGMRAQARLEERAVGKQGIDLRKYILHNGMPTLEAYKTNFVKE